MKQQILALLVIGLTVARGDMTRAATGPLHLVQTIPLPGVEGIAYLPDTDMVAVANGGDGVVTLLDGASLKPVKTIAFGEDADNVVAATWSVSAGAANVPMALDASHHRLFVLTRKAPRLVVLDTIGCFGAGSVIVYAQSDPDDYIELANVPTMAGARRGLFSPDIAVVVGGLSCGADGAAVRKEGSTPVIVFVCEHGSAKSLVAASFFERMAKERGIAVRAISRGTAPDASVPAAVVEALRGDGFDVAAFKPQRLKEEDVSAAARVVAIGVDLGDIGSRARNGVVHWDDIPPFAASYPKARQAILARMRSLLDDLEGRR